jgi:AhpD family alkylhydroperoxidase
MSGPLYPDPEKRLVERRKQLAPRQEAAFKEFGAAVFEPGALPAKAKQLIAVAVAHATQCPYCIRGHVKAARRAGATAEEIMEAIWVAAEMRAGAAYAHSLIALDTLEDAGPSG